MRTNQACGSKNMSNNEEFQTARTQSFSVLVQKEPATLYSRHINTDPDATPGVSCDKDGDGKPKGGWLLSDGKGEGDVSRPSAADATNDRRCVEGTL